MVILLFASLQPDDFAESPNLAPSVHIDLTIPGTSNVGPEALLIRSTYATGI